MPGEVKPDSDPSSWLDSQFFQNVLAKYTCDRDLIVEDCFTALQPAGAEQYTSTVYRVTVSYKSRGHANTIALVVKFVSSKVTRTTTESTLETELHAYRDLLGKMEAAFKHANEQLQFAPKFICAMTDPQPVIILEDISKTDFKQHKALLGYDDAKIVLSKLAYFHAVSYSLSRDVTHKNQDHLTGGLFSQTSSEGVKFLEDNFRTFTEELGKGNSYEAYTQRLQNLVPKFLQHGANVYSGRDTDYSFKVMNHGDFSLNNILFRKTGEDAIEDVIFVDFQLSCWATPAIDLLYFFYLICDANTRNAHRQQLIYFYHKEFTKALDTIGYMGQVPLLLDLHCDIQRAGFLEVVLAVCFVPYLFADYNEVANMYGNEAEALAYRRNLFNHHEYREIIDKLLPFFLQRGFLD